MNQRIKKVWDQLKKNGLKAYLVTCPKDISYLVGFRSSDAWLLLDHGKMIYLTDSRYEAEIKQRLQGKRIKVKVCPQSLGRTLVALVLSSKVKTVGFDERYMTVARHKGLQKKLGPQVKLVPLNGMIEELRAIKEPAEIKKIEKCLALNLLVFKYLRRWLKPGMREREVLARLETYVKSRGARFSFDPIIASGPHSSFPHAGITDRKIRKNEIVLVDLGIEIDGYKSDLTRMFFLGKIPPRIWEQAQVLREAQRRAIEKIGPQVMAAAVDQEARKYLRKNNLEEYFVHSLGHGVGLDIHESPRISSKSVATLKEGMVVTVEPGVYFAGKYGIRFEDMVLVTKNGFRLLS